MVYYCTVEKEGDEYIAQFPDMTNIVTCGFSLEEALDMAKEALDGCLEAAISHGTSIPAPVCTNGYPITVANHITAAFQLQELRGAQSLTDIAKRLELSYQAPTMRASSQVQSNG